MDKLEFEKQFLVLVNKTDVVITAPNIAFNLKIGIEEAQEHLLSLELNGILSQANDQGGNAYYVMPNRPTPGTQPAQLSAAAGDEGGNRQAPGVYNPADLPPAPIYSTPDSAPAQGRAVNGMVLNIIIPGVGSLVAGRMIGLAMLGLLLLGIVLIFVLPGWSKLLCVLPIIGSWIWSIIAGVMLLNQKEAGPGIPGR